MQKNWRKSHFMHFNVHAHLLFIRSICEVIPTRLMQLFYNIQNYLLQQQF